MPGDEPASVDFQRALQGRIGRTPNLLADVSRWLQPDPTNHVSRVKRRPR